MLRQDDVKKVVKHKKSEKIQIGFIMLYRKKYHIFTKETGKHPKRPDIIIDGENVSIFVSNIIFDFFGGTISLILTKTRENAPLCNSCLLWV